MTSKNMIKIIVDDQPLNAAQGTTLLKVCLDNDIFIPNLCFLDGLSSPTASCRLCFVAIEGTAVPVTSCTMPVTDGLVVRTDTPEVRRLQRSAFNLLISVHHLDPHCPAKKNCELIRIAKFLGVKLKHSGLQHIATKKQLDSSHPLFDFHVNRCVLCERCLHTCERQLGQGKSILTFAQRGFDTALTYFGESDASGLPCSSCLACLQICPIKAITLKSDRPEPQQSAS